MKEVIRVNTSQIQRACIRTKVMAYCRTGVIGYNVYMEHPNGRRTYFGPTEADAWQNFAQTLANESITFANALRYFVKFDAEKEAQDANPGP